MIKVQYVSLEQLGNKPYPLRHHYRAYFTKKTTGTPYSLNYILFKNNFEKYLPDSLNSLKDLLDFLKVYVSEKIVEEYTIEISYDFEVFNGTSWETSSHIIAFYEKDHIRVVQGWQYPYFYLIIVL